MGVKSIRYSLIIICKGKVERDREGEEEKRASEPSDFLPCLLCSWWSQLAVGGGVAVAVGELGMQISLSALAAPPGAQMNYSDLVLTECVYRYMCVEVLV